MCNGKEKQGLFCGTTQIFFSLAATQNNHNSGPPPYGGMPEVGDGGRHKRHGQGMMDLWGSEGLTHDDLLFFVKMFHLKITLIKKCKLKMEDEKSASKSCEEGTPCVFFLCCNI